MFLEIKGLTKSFGGLMAVKDLNLTLTQGEIVGLIGPNGSGKTTLFNLISGVFRPDRGQIDFNGREITGLKPHKICQEGVARTFQLTKPFAQLTVLQNIMIGRCFGSNPVKQIKQAEEECERILALVGLSGKNLSKAITLGQVDRKRLEISRALATRPKLLLLDEVMGGLTPAEIEEAMAMIASIGNSGVTLMIVEHVMKAVIGLSNRLIVLNYGEKIADGAPQDIIRTEKVIEAYLGK